MLSSLHLPSVHPCPLLLMAALAGLTREEEAISKYTAVLIKLPFHRELFSRSHFNAHGDIFSAITPITEMDSGDLF